MIPTDLDFGGDVAIVTGAARGLGLAYARYLEAHGADVVTNDIQDPDDDEHEVAAEVKVDISTERGAKTLLDHTLATRGRLDIIVANAGVSWHRMFDDLTISEFDHCIRHNLYTTFHLLRATWPHLVSRGYGRIVTTSSPGIFGIEGRSHYVAAKGAVIALSRTLALEGRARGVAVNCVLPWGATRMARPGSPAPPPDEAAPAVAWLCHRRYPGTGDAFLVGGGRFEKVRWG